MPSTSRFIVNSSERLPEWSDYLAILAGAEKVLGLLADPTDPLARQEAYRLMFMSLAAGFQSTFVDPDLPDFVLTVTNVMNSVGVNPDFIYGYTPIDGIGTYRLSGIRGDAVFVLFDFVAGGMGALDALGPSVGTLDLDKCRIGADGSFDVLLSTERPAGYSGDWFPLDPRAKTAAIRRAYYHWGCKTDTRVAIERLDRPIAQVRMQASEIARRLELLAGFVGRYVEFALRYGKQQRERGLINRLEHDDWAGRGGLDGQHYYQGIFEILPNEALIVETALPERVRYWNIQLNDPMWNTIDWFNHQSSLNGLQADVDRDGRFRAVISLDDPGVPNWLDPGGHVRGSIMLRWMEASSGPEPTLKVVPAASLRTHLPPGTAIMTPPMRQENLRIRRRGAQLRHRW
jgi:hypothetical protein